jgi:regulator of ribonuclease activity B
VTLPLSLHATKTMRLILLDMVELSKRMSELAAEQQGRYDGWAA